MKYFDFENKTWKTLPASIPSIKSTRCHSAVSVGNTLFATGETPDGNNSLFRYDTESNAWDMKQHSCGGSIDNLCIMDDYVYALIHVRFLKDTTWLKGYGKVFLM